MVGFVVIIFLSLLISEKHCNMASIVIRSSNAFISSSNRQKVLCGGFVLSLESLATLLVHLLKIFLTELKSGNYGGKSSPTGIRVTLNKEKR